MRTLSTLSARKRQLNHLCAEAVEQQISQHKVDNNHHRKRRRFLAKQVLKRVSLQQHRSNRHWLHVVTMVFALWGFNGLVMPNEAQAAASFEHLMLDGFDVGHNATPTFADIDNDGDLDAFVGESRGSVKFYRNTSVEDGGTATAPRFVVDAAANPLAVVAIGQSSAPTFADIDDDGDLDAFVGEYYGTVAFYRNYSMEDGGTASAPRFVADVGGNPLAAVAVGYVAATPTFADIDNDGDLDVLVGADNGTLAFYRNFSMEDGGTAAAPRFVIDDAGNPLAGVNVGSQAAPTFVDIDNDDDLDAFVGESNGTVKFYQNDGDVWAPNLVPVDGVTVINPLAMLGANNSNSSAPSFADIDHDGDLDAFIGYSDGTVTFYHNTSMEDGGTATAPRFVAYAAGNPLTGFDVGGYASPSFADIDHDGDLDAFVGESNGTVKFYQNDDSNLTPDFVASDGINIINPLAGFDVGNNAAPIFADIDNDGDLDAFVGRTNGTVAFYRNASMEDGGTAMAPRFVADAAGNPLAGVAVLDGYASPTFADIDDDGDLDAFVGEYYGMVMFYRNYSMEDSGSAAAPRFVADTAGNPLAGAYVDYYAKPAFADIDNDGDLDAFVGESYGSLKFYRNTSMEDSGTATAPRFVSDTAGNPLAGFGVGNAAAPTFADIDSDGDLDIFVGEEQGSVRFFENLDPVPLPVDDSLDAIAGVTVTTDDVTANDEFKLEAPAGTFTITAFDATTANGATVTYNGDNTFSYTALADFAGSDSFTYTLDDGAGNTAVGRVTVTVSGGVTDSANSSGGGGALNPWSFLLLPLVIWLRRKNRKH